MNKKNLLLNMLTAGITIGFGGIVWALAIVLFVDESFLISETNKLANCIEGGLGILILYLGVNRFAHYIKEYLKR